MKKGQSKVLFFLGVVLILTAGLLFMIVSKPGGTTGQVISEIEEINRLSEPFELRAWVVSSNGVQLDVQNNGAERLIIHEVTVEGCGSSLQTGFLAPAESRVYQFFCPLEEGSEFSGNIRLSFSAENTQETLTSEGVVKDYV